MAYVLEMRPCKLMLLAFLQVVSYRVRKHPAAGYEGPPRHEPWHIKSDKTPRAIAHKRTCHSSSTPRMAPGMAPVMLGEDSSAAHAS